MITGETDLVLNGNFKVKFNNQQKIILDLIMIKQI